MSVAFPPSSYQSPKKAKTVPEVKYNVTASPGGLTDEMLNMLLDGNAHMGFEESALAEGAITTAPVGEPLDNAAVMKHLKEAMPIDAHVFSWDFGQLVALKGAVEANPMWWKYPLWVFPMFENTVPGAGPHWTIAVIGNLTQYGAYADFYDPLGGAVPVTAKRILTYFKAYIHTQGYIPPPILMRRAGGPRQMQNTNCSVYCILYAEHLLKYDLVEFTFADVSEKLAAYLMKPAA